MRNITELIEEYLKSVINGSHSNIIEIKRSELANRFQCVPSQVNYVINTRFTYERGYIVESKRGGGGFIRIKKVSYKSQFHVVDEIILNIGPNLTQVQAQDFLIRLHESRLLTDRETRIMMSALDRNVIALELPYRDKLRARILKSMLLSLRHQ